MSGSGVFKSPIHVHQLQTNPDQIVCNTPLQCGVICMLHCVGLRRLSGLLIQVGRRHSPPDASTNIFTLLTEELGSGFDLYLRRVSICNTWPVSCVLINTEMTHLVSCSIVHNTVACSPVRSTACSLVSFSRYYPTPLSLVAHVYPPILHSPAHPFARSLIRRNSIVISPSEEFGLFYTTASVYGRVGFVSGSAVN